MYLILLFYHPQWCSTITLLLFSWCRWFCQQALHQKQVKKRVTFFITFTKFFIFRINNAFFNVFNFFPNVYYNYELKYCQLFGTAECDVVVKSESCCWCFVSFVRKRRRLWSRWDLILTQPRLNCVAQRPSQPRKQLWVCFVSPCCTFCCCCYWWSMTAFSSTVSSVTNIGVRCCFVLLYNTLH